MLHVTTHDIISCPQTLVIIPPSSLVVMATWAGLLPPVGRGDALYLPITTSEVPDPAGHTHSCSVYPPCSCQQLAFRSCACFGEGCGFLRAWNYFFCCPYVQGTLKLEGRWLMYTRLHGVTSQKVVVFVVTIYQLKFSCLSLRGYAILRPVK
jgi:hypothetical protein